MRRVRFVSQHLSVTASGLGPMRRAVVAVVLALMGAGCGGGGGLPLLVPPPAVTPPPVVNGSISATFDPALVSAESVDGQSAQPPLPHNRGQSAAI